MQEALPLSRRWQSTPAIRKPYLLRTGPFTTRVDTEEPSLRTLHQWCYGMASESEEHIIQFNVSVRNGPLLRRLFSPQVSFSSEGAAPFQPFPRDHAFPLFEWGLNWCIATRAHQYLMLHSGSVELNGFALLLPALPGSGKSTLTAALAYRGWRLMSDEFSLVQLQSGLLHPIPRAVPLKNQSIDVIRKFAPEAALGPLFKRTRKGDVAHVRPPPDSLQRQLETARPRWIVFPRYQANRPTRLTPMLKSMAFTRLAHNSFNYRLIGAMGFERLSSLIRTCACYSAEFSDLEDMVRTLTDLASSDPG